MIWKDYSRLKGTHAICGASNYAWRNYDDAKLEQRLIARYAAPVGTALHEFAAANITHKMKLGKGDKKIVQRFLLVDKNIPPAAFDLDFLYPNLMLYVNDAIGFRMDPEIVLYYSPYCYGTADCINWDGSILQISDLKTGITPASFVQLENYAAFFCLDYKVKPSQISKIIFRIYQGGNVISQEPDSIVLNPIIEQIIRFNKKIAKFEEG